MSRRILIVKCKQTRARCNTREASKRASGGWCACDCTRTTLRVASVVTVRESACNRKATSHGAVSSARVVRFRQQ
eukprot:1277681-Pleurochrysis_carterae.AAC.3